MLKRLLPTACLTFSLLINLPLNAQNQPSALAPPAAPAAPDAKNDDPLWSQYVDSEQKLADVGPGSSISAADQKKMVADLTDLANKLVAKYPKDDRTWEVRLTLLDLKGLQGFLDGSKPDMKEVEARYSPLANNSDAPMEIRAATQIRITGPSINLLLHSPSITQDTLNQVDKQIEDYKTAFKGQDILEKVVPQLRTMELDALHEAGKLDLLQSELTKLSADPDPNVSDMATQMQTALVKMEELIKKPVDLKFTAVDGTEVDFAKLRGKVVLLDFWATWCPPCVEEVPHVVAAYKKYHDQGFEVIGVSLDQDKNQLSSFTKAQGMVWPQAFDGKSFDGDIPSSFGIQSIPQMILINKQGQMLPESAREDLDGKVAKLLKDQAISDAGK